MGIDGENTPNFYVYISGLAKAVPCTINKEKLYFLLEKHMGIPNN